MAPKRLQDMIRVMQAMSPAGVSKRAIALAVYTLTYHGTGLRIPPGARRSIENTVGNYLSLYKDVFKKIRRGCWALTDDDALLRAILEGNGTDSSSTSRTNRLLRSYRPRTTSTSSGSTTTTTSFSSLNIASTGAPDVYGGAGPSTHLGSTSGLNNPQINTTIDPPYRTPMSIGSGVDLHTQHLRQSSYPTSYDGRLNVPEDQRLQYLTPTLGHETPAPNVSWLTHLGAPESPSGADLRTLSDNSSTLTMKPQQAFTTVPSHWGSLSGTHFGATAMGQPPNPSTPATFPSAPQTTEWTFRYDNTCAVGESQYVQPTHYGLHASPGANQLSLSNVTNPSDYFNRGHPYPSYDTVPRAFMPEYVHIWPTDDGHYSFGNPGPSSSTETNPSI